MFVGSGKPRKPIQRAEARRLRRELGLPYKEIARRLAVSPHSVHNWTRDIPITEEHRKRNLSHMTPETEIVKRRTQTWIEKHRRRRSAFQEEGRRRARDGDALHEAGCMLYWAEGSKSRNVVVLANSDVHLVCFFKRFLEVNFGVRANDLTVRLNVYLGNGMNLAEIENWWLRQLDLPRTCLRKSMVNHYPTSSSGEKTNRLPYGVCALQVCNTRLVQHIYGAIQEYGGFEEPRWLDGPPRKSSAASTV